MLTLIVRRIEWAVHNIIGHPIMEIFFLLGLEKAGLWFHEQTLPEEAEDFVPICNQYAIDQELADYIEEQIEKSEKESSNEQ